MCFKKFSKLTKQFLALFMALIVLLSFTDAAAGKQKLKNIMLAFCQELAILLRQ